MAARPSATAARAGGHGGVA
uniref:Uncharacterized protein n=1 Tax=Arundo donax TaxID=35708 RepID=A0A0A9A9L4_ARUDO